MRRVRYAAGSGDPVTARLVSERRRTDRLNRRRVPVPGLRFSIRGPSTANQPLPTLSAAPGRPTPNTTC
jgi:hypothetical protein